MPNYAVSKMIRRAKIYVLQYVVPDYINSGKFVSLLLGANPSHPSMHEDPNFSH